MRGKRKSAYDLIVNEQIEYIAALYHPKGPVKGQASATRYSPPLSERSANYMLANCDLFYMKPAYRVKIKWRVEFMVSKEFRSRSMFFPQPG